MYRLGLFLSFVAVFVSSCNQKINFHANFNNINDRIWIGEDYWQIPLEEWNVTKGRLECSGITPNARVNILTRVLTGKNGSFKLSARMGLLDAGNEKGAVGFQVGIYDKNDSTIRAACYFGEGINAGVSLEGYAFLSGKRVDLPKDFNWNEFTVTIKGNNKSVSLKVIDTYGNSTQKITSDVNKPLKGLVAIVCNPDFEKDKNPGNSKFWFDDLKLFGTKVIEKSENAFGPILWAMYTLNRSKVKLMAFLPPIGKQDNQQVNLQLYENGQWETVATETIEPDSRTAVFKLENWDSTQDVDYRVTYTENDKKGIEEKHFYKGLIRKEPVDRPLKMGGLTCQNHTGYPYTPLVENLTKLDPDLLYFSGDQIYENNGGYGVKRDPAELSIVNYLGKYYLFGWAFGDLIRNRPTVCTPDDHDVYHGNLWGESGKHLPLTNNPLKDNLAGFRQSTRMVNVVNRTQCGNLPDPFDPTTIDEGMNVWYTSLTYGRVSFAIVSDRIFKSGPEEVAFWNNRKDHLIKPLKNPQRLIKPDLKLLGDRQIKFLKNWIYDWKEVDMKVLLSQTVFANAATHHGGLMEHIAGDLDSGGWPKNGRDKAIDILRKCFAFHINGDQHLPTMIQYGIDNYRDAGWSFCTPAIAVGYQRAFLPDELGWKVNGRPEHGNPNTGLYEDAFGNKNYVYAVGNPSKKLMGNRYLKAHMKSSGFGIITFDKESRNIHIDSWKFLANVENPGPNDQFPGWPLTINQLDNYGREAKGYLPEISVNIPNQLLQVIDGNGDLVYIVRIAGNSFKPKVFHKGNYTVIVGEGNSAKTIKNISTTSTEVISIEL